jgi:hypothetical protein
VSGKRLSGGVGRDDGDDDAVLGFSQRRLAKMLPS